MRVTKCQNPSRGDKDSAEPSKDKHLQTGRANVVWVTHSISPTDAQLSCCDRTLCRVLCNGGGVCMLHPPLTFAQMSPFTSACSVTLLIPFCGVNKIIEGPGNQIHLCPEQLQISKGSWLTLSECLGTVSYQWPHMVILLSILIHLTFFTSLMVGQRSLWPPQLCRRY